MRRGDAGLPENRDADAVRTAGGDVSLEAAPGVHLHEAAPGRDAKMLADAESPPLRRPSFQPGPTTDSRAQTIGAHDETAGDGRLIFAAGCHGTAGPLHPGYTHAFAEGDIGRRAGDLAEGGREGRTPDPATGTGFKLGLDGLAGRSDVANSCEGSPVGGGKQAVGADILEEAQSRWHDTLPADLVGRQ